MSGFNRIVIMGNLVSDPIKTLTPTGTSACKFTVANSRKNKNGVSESVFMDVEAWSHHADTIAGHFHKGKPIFVIGRVKANKWIDQEGKERTKLVTVLESFEFVGQGPDKSLTAGFKVVGREPEDSTDDPFKDLS